MKFAVCGLGFIFPRHKEAIEKTGGEIVLTCDINPDKKADFTDYKEMFNSPQFVLVDAVSICTPNYTHTEIAREAVKKGKRVLCEKPLTIFQDYHGLGGVKVVLQLRHNPKVQLLKGETHNIDIFVKTYREEEYWKSWKGAPELSGGILYNMGVHYIDLLIYLLGEPVEIKKSVYSDTLAYGEVLFERGRGTYYIELTREPMSGPIRKITVDGIPQDLEGATIPLHGGNVRNLHIKVYEEFIKGKGPGVNTARKSLNLIERLKSWN